MTRHTALPFVLILLLSPLGGRPSAQQTPPAQRAAGSVGARTTGILVDVVVRDRRGQPVRDLTAGDFEVYEDGVLQDLGSVTFYAGPETPPAPGADAPAAAAPATATVSAPTPARVDPSAPPAVAPAPPPVVALVFDRLSPEARALAQRAAAGYVGADSDAMIAVYGIDLSLTTYQSYTRDTSLLTKAIDAIGSRATSTFGAAGRSEAAERATGAANTLGTLQSAASAGGPAAAGAGANIAAAAPAAQFAEMERRMLETFDVLERDQQGHATSNGLLAVVNSMRALPGRKSVVFFSEGLAIPPNVLAQFRSVIDTANRANVSIYAMDAAGLRTESTSKETRENIMAASQRALARNPTVDVTGAAMTTALERNEDLLRLDPHSGLGQLTNETGGFLVRNTNDMTAGFRRVDQDMRNYYMLTYVPKNDTFDGKFRTIDVKVRRSGVEVAARKGYYAVASAGAEPIMTYEPPALAMLDSTPVPNAFPVRAAAARFPEAERPGLLPVVVTLNASDLTYLPDENLKTTRADFTVLVRFRDQNGDIAGKLSQHYELNAPASEVESLKQGSVLFYRQPELPPGLYTMETVVYDALGSRASVRFATVEQPKVDPSALRVSSLLLIQRGERLAATERPEDNPFLVGDMLLYPNLGEPIRKSAESELAFFFTVYTVAGAAAPEATLELLQNGKLLARSPLALEAPDANGRIQQVGRLPTAPLAPGTYDLRVLIGKEQDREVRSTLVRIVE